MYQQQYKYILTEILNVAPKGLKLNNWPKMPTALREYYELAGSNSEINEIFNFLINPNEWEEEAGFLVFYCENQGVVFWGIKIEDIEKPNPPVYVLWFEDELRVTEIKAALENETTTDFIISMTLLQAVCGGLDLQWQDSINDEVEKSIINQYKKLASSSDFTFYGEKGLVILIANEKQDGLTTIIWSAYEMDKIDQVKHLIGCL